MTENLTIFGSNPYIVEPESKSLKRRWTNHPDSDLGCLTVGDDEGKTDFLWYQTVVVFSVGISLTLCATLFVYQSTKLF
jgi:hypothetical protein